ncbi:MAG: hypothetical protein AB1611_08845 [bacterium]
MKREAVSFHPYVQFDFGLGVGGGIGPIMVIAGDASFVNFPLKLDVRYAIPRISVSPYVRAGLSYHAASGDYVDRSKPGVFAAVGVEFLRTKKVGFGFELSFYQAEIEFERKVETSYYYNYYYHTDYITTTEKIKPCEFTASIFAVF